MRTPVIVLPRLIDEADFYSHLHAGAHADDICPTPKNLDGLNDLVRGIRHSVDKVIAPNLDAVIPTARFYALCEIFRSYGISLQIHN